MEAVESLEEYPEENLGAFPDEFEEWYEEVLDGWPEEYSEEDSGEALLYYKWALETNPFNTQVALRKQLLEGNATK